MADITKTVKYLLVGDASGLSKTLSGASRDLGSLGKGGGLKGLGADLANAVRSGQGLKGVGGVLKNASKEAGGLGSMAGKAAIGIGAAGAAAVVAGAAIAVKFGADSVDAFKKVAGEVSKVKRLTGMTTEDASRLNFAFKQTGVDAGTGAKGIQMLGKNLGNAADGGKKAAAMADTLGFAFTDANGKVKPMSELMPKIADKFANMPDGANKTALAMKLFGKSGTEMLPFLNKGAAGLQDLADKSDKFGNTLNDKQLQALKDSKQAQRDWDAAMQGLQVTLGGALLPLLTQGANMINSVAVPAFQSMAQWINKNQGMFDALGNMMRWVWNNILLPLVKFAVTGFIEMNKPLAAGVILLGKLTGNQDMVNFGQGVMDAANDVETFVNGLQGIPDKVAPTVKVNDQATSLVTAIDHRIQSIKDKIVKAKAEGDTTEVDKLQKKLDDLKDKRVAAVAAAAGGGAVDDLRDRIAAIKDKTITIRANVAKGDLATIQLKVGKGGTMKLSASAAGALHLPKLYRGSDGMQLFNEPETGGEAFIPLARDWRRPRAVAIWRQTGRELGVYAAGGISGGSSMSASQLVQQIRIEVKASPATDRLALGKELYELLLYLAGQTTGGRGLKGLAATT